MVTNIIAIILGIIGLIGCFVPILPGPPISWGALLLLYFCGDGTMKLSFLLVWLAVTILVTVLDYIVPPYFTRVTGGSKVAGRGSLAGLIIGIVFFPPFGMIIGAFLGALLAEVFFNGTEWQKSIKPAFGSFLGFLCGTFIKLASSAVMMWYIIKFLG